MLTLVGQDQRIHHKLNHCSTVTSRLSSSDPNLQNIPRGDKSLAKRMFVSRFGSEGRLIEIDYSQLEVIVQGVLTKDEQLCQDIRDGVDFHVKRLAAVDGRSYSVLHSLRLSGDSAVNAARTKIKSFTFARAYGAGPTSIAADTGMPIQQVKDLIKAEDNLYPGVGLFDASVERAIKKSRALADGEFLFFDTAKHPVHTGEWFSPTGTRYVWSTHESMDFMKDQGVLTSFSPTERKNWPVQGFGGEIVQTMIGKLWRWFNQSGNFGNRAFLTNTVHDCVLIDCQKEMVDFIVPTAKRILEAVPFYFKHDFGLDIDVPFPCSVEVGPNWYEMEKYNE
jgi:DNA polymerase-1